MHALRINIFEKNNNNKQMVKVRPKVRLSHFPLNRHTQKEGGRVMIVSVKLKCT